MADADRVVVRRIGSWCSSSVVDAVAGMVTEQRFRYGFVASRDPTEAGSRTRRAEEGSAAWPEQAG